MNPNKKVTDPALLDQLEGRRVKDPALLSQLNEEYPEDAGAYLDNLPEPEGFFSKLPRNILAGLAQQGHSLINAPKDIAQTFEKRGQEFSSGLKSFGPKIKTKDALSQYIPSQQEYNFAQMLGQQGEGTLSDKLIQQGIEYAPEIAAGRGLLRAGLRKFPVTQRGAARQLREAEKLINKRGINNFQMNAPLLQETVPFLPKTHATGEMLQGIINGEYAPAFALQSQIGQHARNLAKSPLASERLLAPQARELKQLILHEMEQALRGTGHHYEADLLKGGINDYRKYNQIKEKIFPVLKKIGIPTTGLTALGLGAYKGKRLLKKIID